MIDRNAGLFGGEERQSVDNLTVSALGARVWCVACDPAGALTGEII